MKAVILAAATIIAFALAAEAFPSPQKNAKEYPLKLQPELDSFDLDSYLRNERLLDLQIKCVLEKAPCDTVGRWVKPRVGAAVTSGTCLECTDKQKEGMKTVLAKVQEKRPDAFKEIVAKYSA